jgi:DNA gyrase/topoisomerase IV subunit B
MRNLIDQYQVTYDSDDLMFVVHGESESKPNMEFIMHESALHYYNSRKKQHLTFVNTVSENKTGFTKRQIKGAELTQTLYKTLSYPSMKDFKWVTSSNQIKECPINIQDIDVAMKMWGKNIAALKGKTTRSKTHSVARDCVKVYKELLKLHKEVFLKTDIFFVNTIPFFLTLSCYIYQPPCVQSYPEDIQGFQGDVPILSTTWFPHHYGTS